MLHCTRMTISHKTHSVFYIVGLAAFTMILAGLALVLFPKFSIAPTPGGQITETVKAPEASSPVMFDNFGNHARMTPKQVIEGTAPGYWFFEGTFPVSLQDINGNTFTTIPAKTDEDWMITEHSTFTVTMPETFSYTGVGSILFRKDDPSDGEAPFNPEKDQLLVPVIFENKE